MTNPTYPAQQGQPVPTPPRNGLGTAALVLGIIALLLSWVPIIGFIGFVLGILALVLGIVGILRARKGHASNLVVAAVGTGLGALAIVISTAVFGVFAYEVDKQINESGMVSGADAPAPQVPQVPQQDQGPAMAEFGETYTWRGGEAITISAPREHTSHNQFLAAPDGKRYAAVDVTVNNGSDQPYQVMLTQLSAQHAGHVAKENYTAGDPLPNAEIPPGGDVTFTKVWEINEQPGELQVSVKPNAFAGKTVFFKGQY